MTGRRKTFLIQAATHATVLIVWELVSRFIIPPQFLPPPSAIIAAFWRTTLSGELPLQLWQTTEVLLLGFSLSVIIGMAVGIAMFLTCLVAVFPVIINAQIGVMNVSPAFIETARAFGCNQWQVFRRVVLYAAVPFFVAGVRLGLGRALVGVVVAEMFTALSGLGYMVVFYGNTFRTAELFVPIVVLALLSIAITNVIYRFERWIAPWRVVQG